MVCDSAKITGIAGAIQDLKGQIAVEEQNKVKQDKFCNSAYDAYEAAYLASNSAENNAHNAEMTLKQKQAQLELLKFEMNKKIRETEDPKEIEEIKKHYEPLINGLTSEIAYFSDNEKKKANLEYTDASAMKQTTKFGWFTATNKFLQICGTLLSNYYDLGKLQRSAYLEEHYKNQSGNIDYLT